ncbi:MAG: hypothetical protein J6I74_08510 [Schwartzia sp.]|nr:hypothetical protein [Schwartzia sp. (in: firmicutes)]
MYASASSAFALWKGNGFSDSSTAPAALSSFMLATTGYAAADSANASLLSAIGADWTSYGSSYTSLTSTISSETANIDSSIATAASINTATTLTGGLAAAQANYDNAVAYKESIGGACILNGSKVGQDYYGNVISTPDLGSAVTITANGRGIAGQIAGFTISVTDTEGNIKKSANAVLDAWNETIRAENASEEDNALVLQTGTKANQAIKIRLTDMRAQALGLQGKNGNTLNISTQQNANAAINVLDNAIQKALDQQTTIGSIESRLMYTSTNLTTAAENVTASESTIRDADMAQAMTQYTKNNILMQASQAMLAQANQSNNQVLSLLR